MNQLLIKRKQSETFRANGNVSCINCSTYGEPKKLGTIMVLEDDCFFCLHCYRILEGLMN